MYKPTDLTLIPQSERNIGGWISPDGKFFQAHFYRHAQVARYIVEEYLCVSDFVYFPDDYLSDHGWFRLETDGDCWRFPRNTTGQQVEVLFWCYARGGDDGYDRRIYRLVKAYGATDEPVGVSRPSLPPQGDQENVHWTQAEKHLRMVSLFSH